MTIEQKKDNVLLERWEVKGTLSFDAATPSNLQITQEIAKELHSEEGLVVVNHIYNEFGAKRVKFNAVIYKNAAAKQKFHVTLSHLKKKEKVKAPKQGGKK